ncbi:MAG: HAD-IA family hydrolase [Clostridia bacterium]
MQTVIFDFDGVLIDSSIDICNAVNFTLELYDRRRLPNETIVAYVGTGAKKLLRLCFAEAENTAAEQTPFDLETVYDTYLAYYLAHCADASALYNGVVETLKRLKQAKIHCAIVTNKPELLTKKICDELQITQYFDLIVGPESLATMKPDPEGIQLVLSATNTAPAQALMVGDSDSDIFAGKNAGVKTCAVTFGLGDLTRLLAAQPDLIVEQFSEIYTGLLAP